MSAHRKVALVTGSSKGIGRGIVNALSTTGFSTVVTSRSLQQAQAAADEVNAQGGTAIGLSFSLENAADMAAVIEAATRHFGRLDVLVNNAITQSAAMPLNAVDDALMNGIFTANISHVMQLCKYAYPHLRESKGSVINISSVIVNRHVFGLPLYGVIKGAIIQMTKILAAEWAQDSVRVNAINPGFTRTSVFEGLGLPADFIDRAFEFYTRYHPLGRLGQPEDVGHMAAFLASPSASLITGSVFDVDGGYSAMAVMPYQGS